MTNILRIPANTQAYLFVRRDIAQDKFDVKKFVYDYVNAESFPPAWAYWKMEEDGTNRLDSSGNGRYLYPNGYANQPLRADGKINYCAKFVGDNYGVNFRSDEVFTMGADQNYTFAFWVKCNFTATGSSVNYFQFSLTDFVEDPGSFLDVRIMGNYTLWGMDELYIKTTCGYYDAEWVWHELFITTDPNSYTLESDTWHFVCVYYDGTGLYMEIDNVLFGSDLGKHNIPTSPTRIIVGNAVHSGTQSYIDEAGIWDVALTADQRSQLWNSGAGWSPY